MDWYRVMEKIKLLLPILSVASNSYKKYKCSWTRKIHSYQWATASDAQVSCQNLCMGLEGL